MSETTKIKLQVPVIECAEGIMFSELAGQMVKIDYHKRELYVLRQQGPAYSWVKATDESSS